MLWVVIKNWNIVYVLFNYVQHFTFYFWNYDYGLWSIRSNIIFYLLFQVILLESLLNSLNQQIKLKSVVLIIENCIEISMHSFISTCNLSASRLAATLINKYIDGMFFTVDYNMHVH